MIKPMLDMMTTLLYSLLSCLTGTMARVEPNRRWFGNTRIIGQKELQHFREAMDKVKNDPYKVMMRQNKLPMSLLHTGHPLLSGHPLFSGQVVSFSYPILSYTSRNPPHPITPVYISTFS